MNPAPGNVPAVPLKIALEGIAIASCERAMKRIAKAFDIPACKGARMIIRYARRR
jgi:hypothetical protein